MAAEQAPKVAVGCSAHLGEGRIFVDERARRDPLETLEPGDAGQVNQDIRLGDAGVRRLLRQT